MDKKNALEMSIRVLDAIGDYVKEKCPEATTGEILAALEALLVSMKFTKLVDELGISDEETESAMFAALMKGLV